MPQRQALSGAQRPGDGQRPGPVGHVPTGEGRREPAVGSPVLGGANSRSLTADGWVHTPAHATNGSPGASRNCQFGRSLEGLLYRAFVTGFGMSCGFASSA